MIQAYSETMFPGAQTQFYDPIGPTGCMFYPTANLLQAVLSGPFPGSAATMRGGKVYTSVAYNVVINTVCFP